MLLAAVTILVGFIILIWSADLFIDGAASIAENMGLSPILIGLTIVSMGTSAPEILVSINASLADAGSLAIGNALGSNIANIGLVLGVTLLVVPITVRSESIRKEIPLLLLVTVAAFALLVDGVLSRLDGVLLLTLLSILMVQMIRAQLQSEDLAAEADEEELPHLKPLRAWLSFIIGLVLLVASSRMLVYGAVIAARELGVSELVIGLTIVAIGTSLPELAATLASAMRGHTDIALGNVIGSNLFNLLAVMAVPGIIEPQILDPQVIYRDYPMMGLLTLLLALTIYLGSRRRKSPTGHSYVGRTVGVLFTSLYALYYYWLHTTI